MCHNSSDLQGRRTGVSSGTVSQGHFREAVIAVFEVRSPIVNLTPRKTLKMALFCDA